MAILKIKKIEISKLSKNQFAYLILRYYPDLILKEYLVCIDYNFRNNTYFEGHLFMEKNLSSAYMMFNELVKKKSFDFLKDRNDEVKEDIENDNIITSE